MSEVEVTEQNRRALCSDLSERVQALERRLQIEVQTRDRETSDLYRRLTHLRLEVEESGCSAGAERSLPPKSSSVHTNDDNAEVERGATLGLLRIMGVTGTPLRRSLVDMLLQEGLIATTDPRSGGARRPFSQLQQKGLVEAVIVSRESGGHPMHLFRLTHPGQDLYRHMYHGDPVESAYDRLLRRHKSPEHVLLNLQAAKILEPWADAVDLFPSRLQVEGVGVFDPDIVAIVDGKPIFVECERGQGSRRELADRKWEILAAASGGQLHAIVPNRAVEQRVTRDIGRWAEENQASVVLRVSTISVWMRERPSPPWTSERVFGSASPSGRD